jgi:hypothetical protein
MAHIITDVGIFGGDRASESFRRITDRSAWRGGGCSAYLRALDDVTRPGWNPLPEEHLLTSV